ncbi:hypothetical protein RND81_07G087200 [Saponaria officinalis]|uniref:Uncharacterized protein n=1 Tax=Saponaria officinalis TaxID=3572 RepID=A0AAW1JN98_SAPOF
MNGLLNPSFLSSLKKCNASLQNYKGTRFLNNRRPTSIWKKNIQDLEKNSVTSLKTLINLGSEVYAQGEVPDTRHIFVDVGFGFNVEFTLSEAINFILAKEQWLAKFSPLLGSSFFSAHHLLYNPTVLQFFFNCGLSVLLQLWSSG